jgi:DHA2 family multidrug resistance protein
MQSGSIAFQHYSQALSGYFGGHFGDPNATSMALANMYNQLNQQAALQGYQDVYMQLSWMSLGLIGLSFLLSKNRPGQGPGSTAMH